MQTNRDLTNPVFLGKRAEELSALIEQQLLPIFAQLGIVVPVRSCSLLTALEGNQVASAADLAKILGQSHQLVLQKIPALLKLRLISRRADSKDARRRVFALTAKGTQQSGLLREAFVTLAGVYERLDQEIGVRLFDVLGKALAALDETDMGTRFRRIDP